MPVPTPLPVTSVLGSATRRLRAVRLLGASATTGAVVASSLALPPGAAARTQPLTDSYSRTVASGWGTASSGTAWTPSYSPSDFSVGSGTGRVAVARAGSSRQVMAGTALRDVDVVATVSPATLPGGAFGSTAAVVARAVPGTGEYRARLRFTADGTVRALVSRVTAAGTEVFIGGEPVVDGVTATAGARYRLRVSVTGAAPTTLTVKAWAAGTTEPAAWGHTVTDSTPSLGVAGRPGLRFYLGTGAPTGTSFTVDDVVVSDPATTTPPVPAVATRSGRVSADPAPPRGRNAVGRAVGASRRPSYAVPAGARFVSPAGSDAAPGSARAPWRTLTRAVSATPSGGTIVVRGGTYHEDVRLPHGKRLTVQNAPGETVWLDGSRVVTGWVRDGSAWRLDGWRVRFSAADSTGLVVDPAHPMAAHPDMVFRGGVGLRQVGRRAQVRPGTFYVDYAASRLWIGSNPAGHEMRASDLSEGLYVNRGHSSVIRGIGVRRFATPLSRVAAVKAFADGVVLENVVAVDNATGGISVKGSGVRVVDSTSTRNGQLGVHAHHADHLLVARSVVGGNNAEHFATGHHAAGIKITSSRHGAVRDSDVSHNRGNGIWWDESTFDTRTVRNSVRENAAAGVFVELSDQALVAGNLLLGNAGSGLQVYDSTDVHAWNNTLVRNTTNIKVLDGARVARDRAARGHDRRHPRDPNMTWVTRGVLLRNNVVTGGTAATRMYLNVDDVTRARPASAMVDSDYDVFYRPVAGAPGWLVAWGTWPVRMRTFGGLPGFRSGTGQEVHGAGYDGAADPLQFDPAGDRFTLGAASPLKGKGAPLPAHVASVLGRTAGSAVDPGVLD